MGLALVGLRRAPLGSALLCLQEAPRLRVDAFQDRVGEVQHILGVNLCQRRGRVSTVVSILLDAFSELSKLIRKALGIKKPFKPMTKAKSNLPIQPWLFGLWQKAFGCQVQTLSAHRTGRAIAADRKTGSRLFVGYLNIGGDELGNFARVKVFWCYNSQYFDMSVYSDVKAEKISSNFDRLLSNKYRTSSTPSASAECFINSSPSIFFANLDVRNDFERDHACTTPRTIRRQKCHLLCSPPLALALLPKPGYRGVSPRARPHGMCS